MSVQSPTAPPQIQQVINGITARLAQLAKEPPELMLFLRTHAECVATAFKPTGFVYEMRNGPTFQRVVHGNIESLDYRSAPEQENSFQRAVRSAADQRKSLVLQPHSQESTGLQGLAVEDSPAPDELPIFNRTPYEQMFIPLLMGEATMGVLHIWFPPAPVATSQMRLSLLKQVCADAELYFKARRARDVSQEVTRLTTYSKLLEELTGDLELDSVGWNLVNYAREAVGCERVCLFIAENYNRAMVPGTVLASLEYDFELQACSGLKKPHAKSEQAVILQRVAQTLAQMSLGKSQPTAAVAGEAAPTPNAETARKAEVPMTITRGGVAPRPQIQTVLMMRDPAKTPTRPPEVNDYFQLMPMNWATVIPLLDRSDRVCGILLFEGVKVDEKLASSLRPMQDLAVSAGRALGTALYCNQNRSMRMARRVVAARQQFVNTPARRKFLRYGLPLLAVAAILAFPINHDIDGNATVLPTQQTTLPALVNSRLLEVLVREGEPVKSGQVLARFDTKDIRLQLAQVEQEYERSLLESDTALNAGNESQMQLARLNAEKAAAVAAKLRSDLGRAEVRAPFDGLVLGAQTLSTRNGDIPRMGEPILQVINPTSWQVKANLRERDVIALGERLKTVRPIPASLRLASDPAHTYDVALTDENQLAFGLDTTTMDYQFTAIVPLNQLIDDPALLKSGFTGRISFEGGKRSIAYVMFKDFYDFLRVRFL
jgi:hypothetical protein